MRQNCSHSFDVPGCSLLAHSLHLPCPLCVSVVPPLCIPIAMFARLSQHATRVSNMSRGVAAGVAIVSSHNNATQIGAGTNYLTVAAMQPCEMQSNPHSILHALASLIEFRPPLLVASSSPL